MIGLYIVCISQLSQASLLDLTEGLGVDRELCCSLSSPPCHASVLEQWSGSNRSDDAVHEDYPKTFSDVSDSVSVSMLSGPWIWNGLSEECFCGNHNRSSEHGVVNITHNHLIGACKTKTTFFLFFFISQLCLTFMPAMTVYMESVHLLRPSILAINIYDNLMWSSRLQNCSPWGAELG